MIKHVKTTSIKGMARTPYYGLTIHLTSGVRTTLTMPCAQYGMVNRELSGQSEIENNQEMKELFDWMSHALDTAIGDYYNTEGGD